MGGISKFKNFVFYIKFMLFDLKPKEKMGDFFNCKDELNSFVDYLTKKSSRMIIIKGLRRTGKSSLLRVGLKKAKAKFVLIDARELTSLSRKSFEIKLFEELRTIKGLHFSLLEKIKGIEAGLRISFKNEETLWHLLKNMDIVIAVDEVQMLRGSGVETFFAAVYDNTSCKIVLTGSEVGVLDAFLGKDDPKAPLFGRTYNEIKMHSLIPEKSKEFLMLGFKEAKKIIPEVVMHEALKELNGIVGWLAMFGNLSLSLDSKKALEKAVTNGAKLAYSELESFLDSRPSAKNRYFALCKIIAGKSLGWSNLKQLFQIELKESISDSQFTNYLNSLKDYGFIIHKEDVYSMPDPLLKRALIGGMSSLWGV